MPLLLDTTVLVDVGRGHAPTTRWLASQALADLYLTVISIGELVRGAYRRSRDQAAPLASALALIERGILARFRGRVLPFDLDAAQVWGRLLGEGSAAGRRPPPDDAKIAAIALCHGMTVATSNTAHFAGLVPVVDPRAA